MQRSAWRARRSSSLPESACASGSAFLQVNSLVSFCAAHSGEDLGCSAFACARRRFLSLARDFSNSARVGAAPVLRSHWSRLASIAAMREVAVSTLLSRWARTLSTCGDRSKESSPTDRKSTRLNSSHLVISYAVFCLKKKKTRLNSNHLVISYAVFCLKKKIENAKPTTIRYQ